MKDVKTYLTSKGFAGQRLGEIFKQIKGMSFEEVQTFVETGEKPEKDSVLLREGTVWWWLCKNPVFENMASNSEKRRWLETGAVELNGNRPEPDDSIVFHLGIEPIIASLVFFPSSPNKRITMI